MYSLGVELKVVLVIGELYLSISLKFRHRKENSWNKKTLIKMKGIHKEPKKQLNELKY